MTANPNPTAAVPCPNPAVCNVLLQGLKDDLGELDKKVDRAVKILEGNGGAGLVIKVDRHEQELKNQRFYRRAFATAIIVFGVTLMGGVLIGVLILIYGQGLLP